MQPIPDREPPKTEEERALRRSDSALVEIKSLYFFKLLSRNKFDTQYQILVEINKRHSLKFSENERAKIDNNFREAREIGRNIQFPFKD